MKKMYTLTGALFILGGAYTATQQGYLFNRITVVLALIGAAIMVAAELIPETSNPYITFGVMLFLVIGLGFGIKEGGKYILSHIEYNDVSIDTPKDWVGKVSYKKTDNGLIIYHKCYCNENLNQNHQKLLKLEWMKNSDIGERRLRNIVYTDNENTVVATYMFEPQHTSRKYEKEYEKIQIHLLDEVKQWIHAKN